MENAPPAPRDIPGLTEHLFRQESGKLVSILTGIFGIDRLQLAEDVVQEALIRAMQTWPYYGIPQNPPAWLLQTAKHLALDIVRREKLFHEKQPDIISTMEQWPTESDTGEQAMFEDEIKDGRLRLMFACCHPLIPLEAQTALALKTLCGLSPAEIARAYLTSEAAIAKRLTRARQKIRDEGIPFEIPSGTELSERLEGVLKILYLLFNEGHKASSGDNLVRADLCDEAIRLARLLTEHPAAGQPSVHALTSLMYFNAARLDSRVDAEGNIIRLREQNRSTWDRDKILRGINHLGLAATGSDFSEYHLQAGIAACHCLAPDYESTNWKAILNHYDRWMLLSDSPVVALNRAVAVAQVHGPAAGIAAVEAIPDRNRLDSYYLFHAVLGEFQAQNENFAVAAAHFRKALSLTEMQTERAFLSKRLQACEPTKGR